MRPFPDAALECLRCPVCGMGFTLDGRSLRCFTGHTYDVAHQGYVNLLPGGARPGTADTAEMVAAREAFLATGHYAGLRDFVADAAERAAREAGQSDRESGAGAPGCIVEVGAGTGYYLSAVLDRLPGQVGLALDISKFAARRAARAHERMAAVVCDAWKTLPIADGAASVVLDIFAPRNPAEFTRILRSDGALLVVTPSPRHLTELVSGLGLLTVDEHKPERLEQALSADFTLVGQATYEEVIRPTRTEAAALASMGPSARHLEAQELAERAAALGDGTAVTISVTAATYVLRTPPRLQPPRPAAP